MQKSYLRTFVSLLGGFLIVGCDNSQKSHVDPSKDENLTSGLIFLPKSGGNSSPPAHSSILDEAEKISVSSSKALGQVLQELFEERSDVMNDIETEQFASSIAGQLRATPEILAESVQESKGILRKKLVDVALGSFIIGNGDNVEVDLLNIYHALPECDDRSRVATQYATEGFFSGGIDEFVSRISKFESQLEKFRAYDNIIVDFKKSWTSGKISEEDYRNLKEGAFDAGYEKEFVRWVNDGIKK